MSYHASNGLGLTRRPRQNRIAPQVITGLRTHADVWFDPNPSGEVATARHSDIGLPLALRRQYVEELAARGGNWIDRLRARGLMGVGEIPYLDCTPEIIAGGTGTACVNENLRRQQANLAEHDQGQRAIHVANCKRDYALNHGGSEAGNPCDSWDYGSTSAYAQPGYTATPAEVYAATPPGGGQPAVINTPAPSTSAPAPNAAPRVSFVNLSRPGQTSALKVGDSWSITLTGQPGAAVSVTGGQNGKSDVTPLGSIDAGGSKVISGQATADQIGSWSESWTVGGVPAGVLRFTIGAASGSTSVAPPPADNAGGGYVPADLIDRAEQFATQDVGGFPVWALLAAGGAALFFFGGRR